MPSTLTNVAAKSAAGSNGPVARAIAAYAPHTPTNVGEVERWLSVAAGGYLLYHGLAGSATRPLAALAGGYLAYRGLTGHCPARQALGLDPVHANAASTVPAGHGVKVEHAVTVARSPADCYRFWRQFDNLPRFMAHLERVELLDAGGRRSRWTAKGPLGLSVTWDAELVTDRADEAISWRSLPGADVDNTGAVHFRPAAGGTEVRVALKYDPPAGKVGAAVARLFGEAPETQVRDDLHRFKAMIEAGAAGR